MNSTEECIDVCNSLLRGELSAVETYRLAINKMENSTHRPLLEHCARSHAERARLLAQEVRRRGGDPADKSGPWGAFAKLVEGSAALFGEKAAIAALEEGEDHGRDDYRHDLPDLDASARQVVEDQILPEQNRTHQALSALKRTMQ